MPKDPKKEVAEGVLRRDSDEGWVLDGEGPRAGIRICDLFPDHDGKRVRITVEVLEDQLKKERKSC